MAKAEAQDAEKRKQERIEKLGFDPEKEDIIDIDPTTGEVAGVGPAKTKAVQTQDTFAVGLPK